MHRAEVSKPKSSDSNKFFTIALMGNPNSGKSTIFNLLTGLRQKIGNFPGVTVDKKIGKLQLKQSKAQIIDFPGTYSLYPTALDERIVVSTLANPANEDFPDAIIYVADSSQLEKHLLLFSQLKDLEVPLILALNMADVITMKTSNTEVLSKKLGIPVVATSGRTGIGIEQLKDTLQNTLINLNTFIPNKSTYQSSKEENVVIDRIKQINPDLNNQQALLWAHHKEWLPGITSTQKTQIGAVISSTDFQPLKSQVRETMSRYEQFLPIFSPFLPKKETQDNGFSDKLDQVITHRFIGPVIFFILMVLVFQAVFSWASLPMEWIDNGFAALGNVVEQTLPESWFRDLLVNGILAGLGGILIFIPQIALLFLLISILEEVGYMARVVYLFDNILKKIGLNGRSIVALVSGGACAIPAVMSTRTISNWKERIITIMVTPLISCSARIPVYTVLIGFVVPASASWAGFNGQGLAFMGLYLLGIFSALFAAFVFKLMLKSEEKSYLMIELPVYRKPMAKNVLLNVFEKTKTFVVEAGKVIFVISIILWVLATYGPGNKMAMAVQSATTQAQELNLDEDRTAHLIASKEIEASFAGHIGKFIEPAIAPLGFDWKIGIALITSFAAREVFVGTMATIYSIGGDAEEKSVIDRLTSEVNPITGKPVYTFATALSLLIFYVFAMQCMSTLAVVKRETKSWKWPIIQFVYMTALAYFGSLFVYQYFS